MATGGVIAAMLSVGALADIVGLRTALIAAAAIATLALPAILLLPGRRVGVGGSAPA